jgi:hypothetical protein
VTYDVSVLIIIGWTRLLPAGEKLDRVSLRIL